MFGLPVTYEDDNSAVFSFGSTVIDLLHVPLLHVPLPGSGGRVLRSASVEAGCTCRNGMWSSGW